MHTHRWAQKLLNRVISLGMNFFSSVSKTRQYGKYHLQNVANLSLALQGTEWFIFNICKKKVHIHYVTSYIYKTKIVTKIHIIVILYHFFLQHCKCTLMIRTCPNMYILYYPWPVECIRVHHIQSVHFCLALASMPCAKNLFSINHKLSLLMMRHDETR